CMVLQQKRSKYLIIRIKINFKSYEKS
ncbi:hypothetical protein AZZ63_001692, partial [Enterobacter hormaechei]